MIRKDITGGLLDFAQEFSGAKTPAFRTKGFKGTRPLGEVDVDDTVGTLMAWRYLAASLRGARGTPRQRVTYYLTANGGDETDLRIDIRGGCVDINVKTSKTFDIAGHRSMEDKAHIFIKEEEVEGAKPLADVYLQIFVHTTKMLKDEKPHVHYAHWIESDTPEFMDRVTAFRNTERKEREVLPGTGGHRGFRIPLNVCRPIEELVPWLQGQGRDVIG